MIPPKQRPIVAAIASLLAIVPLFIFGTIRGQSQGLKNEAETTRQSRLESVAKAVLSENCYIVESIVIGGEVPVIGRAQAICIRLKDGSRYTFIEYQKGVLTAIDAFSRKEVQAKISTLGVPKNARS